MDLLESVDNLWFLSQYNFIWENNDARHSISLQEKATFPRQNFRMPGNQ